MKKYLLIIFLMSLPLSAKVPPERIKGWLELDAIQKNAQSFIQKYQLLSFELQKEANELLQQGIDEADDLAQADPYAALTIYHKIKTVKDISAEKLAAMQAAQERFQELSDYVDLQYKELRKIRLKHLQFPF